jgi:hypothetical protein
LAFPALSLAALQRTQGAEIPLGCRGSAVVTKRITLPIDGNIDAIKASLQQQLGISMSYHQVVDYLIKFYRDHQKPQTIWSNVINERI